MKQLKLPIDMSKKVRLELAYKEAISFTKNHYENFPVLSFFVPKRLYKHIAIIYKYARMADDIADRNDLSVEKKTELLDDFESYLMKALVDDYKNDFWFALSETVFAFQMRPENFFNLLVAFRRDLTVKRYENFEKLLEYCKYSANPVGRMVLELYGVHNEEAKLYSDKICTALQLTNFLQDVAIDFKKDRIYLPLNEMAEFGVGENQFPLKQINGNFKKLMKKQIERITELFNEGEKLLSMLPFMLRKQIAWTINGGREILKRIEENDYDVFNKRPELSKFDLLKLVLK